MYEILTPLPPAELIDRLAGLRLTVEHTKDPACLHHLDGLQRAADQALPANDTLMSLQDALYEVHADLRSVKTDLRQCEADGDFGAAFIALARSVHAVEDERTRIKSEINAFLGVTSDGTDTTGQ